MLEILQHSPAKAQQEDKREEYGLSSQQAQGILEKVGENVIAEKKKSSGMKIFLGQFHDVMVMILLIATVISVILGQYSDAVPMLAVVVINAFLGFIQEYRCEKTLEKLSEMTAPTALVCRDGRFIRIAASQIVPGDVFKVGSGDRVAADGYLISCKGLQCDESLLTGESEAVSKTVRTNEVEFSSLNKSYMAYMGTVVTRGSGLVLVTSTGKQTQMGRVSGMLREIDEGQTPLQKRLGELGTKLAAICIGVCLLVFVAGVLRGEGIFNMVMTSITIAIAAIPEGLPAAVTIALALAVRKMLKRNALVHRLHSVETLGCTSVICTDKTGTVTMNKMTVTEAIGADGEDLTTADPEADERSSRLVRCAALCSNAQVRQVTHSKRKPQRFEAQGDPTECALAVFCAQKGIMADELGYERIDELPFDSSSRSMTVVCRGEQGVFSCKKGSSEVIIPECGYELTAQGEAVFSPERKLAAAAVTEKLASKGMRVLAFSEAVGTKVIFLGIMAMQDPPRPEAAAAVAMCRGAGIRTIMITGDHRLTAAAIARQTGILKEGSLVLTGDELDRLSDEKLWEMIDNCSVFARVTPDHKLRIVRALKAKGHICAMTGDGVNDAPAVKEADIGVAMGISGTEVTKQAADVILLDDNFATLVSAVENGRTIYSNIRKFVRYMISCNIGEVITMLGAILMGLPLVLLPTQILLVNLVTDSLPAIALGVEPAEKSLMQRKPRKSTDSFFSGGLMGRMVIRGMLIGICTLGSFTTVLRLTSSIPHARTAALITLVLNQLIHVFECKSEEKTVFTVPYMSNIPLILAVLVSVFVLGASIALPFFSGIFSTVVPDALSLTIALMFSLIAPVAAAVASLFK